MRYTREFFGANPQASPDLGRLVSKAAAARARTLLAESGAEVLVGGEAPPPPYRCSYRVLHRTRWRSQRLPGLRQRRGARSPGPLGPRG